MEYRRRCLVCGGIYCYTDKDISDSNSSLLDAGLSAVATFASIFGGSMLDTLTLSDTTDKDLKKVRDFLRLEELEKTDIIEIARKKIAKHQKIVKKIGRYIKRLFK